MKLSVCTQASQWRQMNCPVTTDLQSLKPRSTNGQRWNDWLREVSEMLEDGDVKGAVRLAASEEIMAPYNQNTVDALISKHPRALRPPQ
jgi:hypothetical protein